MPDDYDTTRSSPSGRAERGRRGTACAVSVLAAGALAAALLLSSRSPAAASAPVPFSITDLGTLGGATSIGQGVNDAGQVVGTSQWLNAFGTAADHAFIWDPANGMRDLTPGVPGPPDPRQLAGSHANAINAAGQITGWINGYPFSSGQAMAVWTPPTFAPFTTFPGPSRISSGNAINTAGEVAGSALVPFVWDPVRGSRQLPGPDPMDSGTANGLNDSGQVVGNVAGVGGAMWPDPTTVQAIGVLPGQSGSSANAINNAGQVVGSSGSNAFLWQAATGMRDLGPGTALAINARGLIVGTSVERSVPFANPSTGHATLFGQDGSQVDLNALLPPDSGWVLQVANGVNSSGQIVGTGSHNGQRRAYLMTPPAIDADLALSRPDNLTVNATSPAGAAVTYALPTVTDEDATKQSPSCTPGSGSTFAIGATTVTCTVTDSDDANSPVQTTFTVHVKGAAEQLIDLRTAVQGVGPGTSLGDKVTDAQASLAGGNVADTCSRLAAFIHEVQAQAGKSISGPEARTLVATATRIQAVTGCG